MPYTPQEDELITYMETGLGSSSPLVATRFRELRLTGWTEKDERSVTPPLGGDWTSVWFGQHPGNVVGHWQAIAALTFSLRRPLEEDVRVVGSWWNEYRDGEYYTYYDGDRRYSHAIYLDPTGVIGETPNILRLNGTKSSQGLSADLTVEVTKPRQIPLFPQWDDKIIKRFYRSDDPEMRSYTKAVDDWSALMNNAISQLA
jgi:hypothetical protein